ncbi:CD109 antigen-like [Drosophila montana]|uniref:CD109 antigen-like n=1 Tax=Drosophila montana TaxID=40370 RepID=UPI00313E36B1
MSDCLVHKLLLLFLLRLGVGSPQELISSTGNYILSAPANIYSGRPYGVVVSTFNYRFRTIFEVVLSGPSINVSMQMLTTGNFPSSKYTFDIPELEEGLYWLKIKTLRGFQVENSTQLTWRNFKDFIKIQTPKLLYRPGQLLQFRVFFHNETMKPVKPRSKAAIWIEDAKGIHVKVYNSLTVVQGVFQSELRLSLRPNLGRWRICAQNGVRSNEECTHIQVNNYELPYFELNLSAPANVNITDQKFDVAVWAQYISGGPIEGNLTLQFESYTEGEVEHTPQTVTLESELQNGKATVNVKLSQFHAKKLFYIPLQLTLTANVSEKYTHRRVFATTRVTVWDPKSKESPPIKLVPETRAKKRVNLVQIEKFGTPLKNPEKIMFQLNRTLTNAICVVMFNGLILGSESVYPDQSTNEFEILIQLTTKMWPLVHVILYSVDSNSNVLVMARTTITPARPDHEHVVIEAPTEVSPGDEITLRIKSAPNSYVGLAAVDTRVLKLGGNLFNDFSDNYFDTIKAFIQASASDMIHTENHAVQMSGLIFLTNAASVLEMTKDSKTSRQNLRDRLSRGKITMRNELVDFDNRHMEDYICCEIPIVREEYNDVWIFNSTQSKIRNLTTWKLRVPDDMTYWRLSAFAVDSNVGLTLLKPKPYINIKSKKPLFMSLSVPYSIQVDEVLQLVLHCYNNYEEKLKVSFQAMQDDKQYQVLDNDGKPMPEGAKQEVAISSYKTGVVKFNLRALQPGTLNVTIEAMSDVGTDSIVRKIKVLKDPQLLSGQVMAYHKLTLRTPRAEGTLEFPHKPTEEGIKCFVSSQYVAAMPHTLNFFDPLDNGEQLISKMMSIYYLWKYFFDDKNVSQSYREFLEDQLTNGFQSLMRLRRRDGGYRYNFGIEPDCSSTWLTAYAVQLLYLLQSSSISFETRLLMQSEKFLLRRKGEAGYFEESCITPGRRNIKPLELNIEILKVLQFSNSLLNLQIAQDWVNAQMIAEPDYYMLAKRGLDTTEWIRPKTEASDNWIQHRRELETAGRILSESVRRNRREQQSDIFNWLVAQLFQNVIYENCYECSVAEQALYDYVQTQPIETPNLKVLIWEDPNKKLKINIHDKNQWQENLMPLKTQSRNISFKALGVGQVFVRCTYDYKLDNREVQKPKALRYYLSVRITREELMKMRFCAQRFSRERQDYVGSNLELQLPSGYEMDEEHLTRNMSSNEFQFIPLDKNTKLFVILTKLAVGKVICFSMLARLDHKIENLQSGRLTAYDINLWEKREVLPYNFSRTAVFSNLANNNNNNNSNNKRTRILN